MSELAKDFLIALITGGAFGFLEFLIRRRDEKKGGTAKIIERLDKQDEKISAVQDYTLKNHMNILRITIMDESMPMSERLIAGEEYTSKGGNGDVKKTYLRLKEEIDT